MVLWGRNWAMAAAMAAVLTGLTAGGGALAWRRWRLQSRAASYDRLIREAAARHGLAPELVLAVVWKESRFQPFCVGRAGEVGLMQITAGAVQDWWAACGGTLPNRAMCFDPGLNVEIGTWYLARAMRTWKHHRSADILALAEYNAGGTRARRWAPTNPQQEVAVSDVSVSSTRDYIRQVKRKWHDFERTRYTRG